MGEKKKTCIKYARHGDRSSILRWSLSSYGYTCIFPYFVMEKSEETGAGGQNDWNLKSWMGAIVKHRNSHGGSLKISPGPLAQSRLTPDRHLQHIHGKQLVYQPSGSNEAPDVDQHLGWFFGFLRCRRMSGRYQEMNRWVMMGSLRKFAAWQLGSLWLDGTVV